MKAPRKFGPAELVTVAVPSGRLLDGAMRILEAAGYLGGDAWRDSRRLIVQGTDPA